jgi:hypothetical protein
MNSNAAAMILFRAHSSSSRRVLEKNEPPVCCVNLVRAFPDAPLFQLRNLPTTVEPGDSGCDQGKQGNGDR